MDENTYFAIVKKKQRIFIISHLRQCSNFAVKDTSLIELEYSTDTHNYKMIIAQYLINWAIKRVINDDFTVTDMSSIMVRSVFLYIVGMFFFAIVVGFMIGQQ